jgi:hypothetical protein
LEVGESEIPLLLWERVRVDADFDCAVIASFM